MREAVAGCRRLLRARRGRDRISRRSQGRIPQNDSRPPLDIATRRRQVPATAPGVGPARHSMQTTRASQTRSCGHCARTHGRRTARVPRCAQCAGAATSAPGGISSAAAGVAREQARGWCVGSQAHPCMLQCRVVALIGSARRVQSGRLQTKYSRSWLQFRSPAPGTDWV